MSQIHPRLAEDCFLLGRFSLCHLLLMNDCNYPWTILVPDRDDIRELYQLTENEQFQFQRESAALGAAMMRAFSGYKLNIAALGNVVPQLHVHHIVRFQDDPAWPAPVWGKLPAKAYDEAALRKTKELILSHVADIRVE